MRNSIKRTITATLDKVIPELDEQLKEIARSSIHLSKTNGMPRRESNFMCLHTMYVYLDISGATRQLQGHYDFSGRTATITEKELVQQYDIIQDVTTPTVD